MRRSIEIAVIAVFSALTAVVTAYVGSFFPSPTGGYTHIGDSIIFIAALLFGARVGSFVGAIGSMVADLIVHYRFWYVSIIAHGLEGFIAGIAKGKKVYLQALLCFLGGVVMSFTYFSVNVFIKGFGPALASLFRDIFGQTLVSTIIAVPIVKAVEKAMGTRIK
ncbi:MAG: hypothetical protein DRJ66_02825 [Thermoprotei archaeon]|nr:MAG: hypothetical protein DRJ66_02825 [Thermoprotei archaeon]RLF20650.1 MAG: hypothetical protein DRZ82_01355 [Thermoprotei archaeon]